MKPVGKPKKWTGAIKDDPWNKPETQSFNNCYSYAVNVDPQNDKDHGYTVPGKKGGSAITGTDQGSTITVSGQTIPAIKYTCAQVKAACIADGLKAPNDKGKCDEDCWLIAYYVRDPKDGAYPGGYHFVRQNDDGSWSHKDGANPANCLTYHAGPPPVYSDPAITDPSKDPIGAGYTFCDYLCCCPDKVDIAMLAPPPIDPHEQALVRLLSDPAMVTTSQLTISQHALAQEFARLTERYRALWHEGYAADPAGFRVDLPAHDKSRLTFLIGTTAITEVGRVARHIKNPDGALYAAFLSLTSKHTKG